MNVTTVWLIVALLPGVLPANILFFFPGGNVSHKTAVWPWVLELAQRGHNVTFISPHPKTPVSHPNITDHATKQLQEESEKVYQVDRFKIRADGNHRDGKYPKITSDACKAVINSRDIDPVLGSLFGDSSFDLVIVNDIFGECGYYVAHYFNAKIIIYDSCTFIGWFYDMFGVSPESAWVPDVIYEFDNFPLTFWDRVQNSFIAYYWGYTRELLTPSIQEAVQPLFNVNPESLPTIYELANNASFVFVNSHPSVDFARTVPPMFIDVGGMASSSSLTLEEMPQNFKEFMDTSGSSGVVLVSFGSTVLLNTVATRYQAMFFHLFQELPNVRFILRWKGPLPKFLDKVPRNLLVSDWLPQKEILSHPKLKLFVTHGGVSSIQEATYYGVPLIVMPLFADQDYNAYRVQAQEVGLKLEIRDITEEALISSVATVLKNDKFQRNMAEKSLIFRDRPLSAVETAVFYTEFTLRHENISKTFRPVNQNLNAFQRRLMDVYAFYFGAIILAFVCMFYVIKLFVKLVLYALGSNTPHVQNKHVLKKQN